jgi:hypothetical protein
MLNMQQDLSKKGAQQEGWVASLTATDAAKPEIRVVAAPTGVVQDLSKVGAQQAPWVASITKTA